MLFKLLNVNQVFGGKNIYYNLGQFPKKVFHYSLEEYFYKHEENHTFLNEGVGKKKAGLCDSRVICL